MKKIERFLTRRGYRPYDDYIADYDDDRAWVMSENEALLSLLDSIGLEVDFKQKIAWL